MRSLISIAVFLALAGAAIYLAGVPGRLSSRAEIPDRPATAIPEGMEGGSSSTASVPQAAASGAAAEDQAIAVTDRVPVAADGVSAAGSVSSLTPNRLPGAAGSAPAPQDTRLGSVRAIAPLIVAPPELDPTALDREAPRPPLSALSLALPPTPETAEEWDGTTLYRPIAPAAGIVEAMGYLVTVAGAEPLGAGQECRYKDVRWDCGTRARTAFRGLLRGRAVICAMPEGVAGGAASAPCRIGRQNLGKWLVANGWARATPGGPFEALGDKARDAGKGIFGPPPNLAEEPGSLQILRDLTPPVSLPMPAR